MTVVEAIQEVVLGDCLDVLRGLRACSIDAVCTDPPYELNMMGLDWDRTGIAFSVELWREVLRVSKPGAHLAVNAAGRVYHRVACAIHDAGWEPRELAPWIFGTGQFLGRTLAPGIGTRLKTGAEPIGIFRKPFDGDPAESLAKWGTGGLQIERCRLSSDEDESSRLPSNVFIDEEVAEELGWRAKYFYCVKASRAEKDAGLEAFPVRSGGAATRRAEGTVGIKNSRAGAGRTGGQRNPHSTVKPLELVRRMVRLVTPPGPQRVVLDLFNGTGTTLCAAALEGVSALGIEQNAEYVAVARARVVYWRAVAQAAEGQKSLDSERLDNLGVDVKENAVANEFEVVESKAADESENENADTTQGEPDMAFLPAGFGYEVAQAEATVSRQRLADGEYVFLHKRMILKTTKSGDAVIIEHKIVESKAIKPGVEPTPVGTAWGHFMPKYGKAAVMLKPNLKAYALGLLGLADKKGDPAFDKKLGETIDGIGGPSALARGMLIRGITFHTTTDDGEDFLGVNWSPFHGENIVGAASVLQRRAQLDQESPLTDSAEDPPPASQAAAPPLPGAAPPLPAGAPSLPGANPFAGWERYPGNPTPLAPDGTPYYFNAAKKLASEKQILSGQIPA